MSPQIILTVQNRKKKSAEINGWASGLAANQSKNWRTHVQRKTVSWQIIWQIGAQTKLVYLTGVIYAMNTGFVRAIDRSYWLFFDF